MTKHMKKGEYERELARRNRARKRFWRRFHLGSLIVIILVFVIVTLNVFSEKKKLRREAMELYEQGKYEEALAKFDEALAEKQFFADGINADIQMYRGDCLIHLEEFVQAGDTYRSIRDEYGSRHYDKEQIEYLLDLTNGLERFRQGDYISTVATFTRAVENGHEDMAIYAALCYENQSDFEKMREYLDIYAGYHGMDTYMYYKYASYYFKLGDYGQAIAYLNQGEACQDGLYLQKIKYAKIICYKETLDFDMAYDLANQYVAAYPDDREGKDLQAYLDTRVNLNEVPINDRFHLFDGGGENEAAVE